MTSYQQQLHALQVAMREENSVALLPLVKEMRAHEFTKQARVEVYTNGYKERLVAAVQADYPALIHYMGEEHSHRAIHAFVTNTPSHGWDMNRYPVGFANFFQQYSNDAPAKALAQLESAIADMFWQPHAPVLEAATLGSLSEEAFGQLRFEWSQAARLMALEYDANHYLAAYRAGQPLTKMMPCKIYLLVIRFEQEVTRIVLEQAEHDLLQHLASGMRFETALAKMSEPEALAERLPHYLTSWLHYGVFSAAY